MISRIRYENQSRFWLTHKESRQSKGVLRLKEKKLAYYRASEHSLDIFYGVVAVSGLCFFDGIKEV